MSSVRVACEYVCMVGSGKPELIAVSFGVANVVRPIKLIHVAEFPRIDELAGLILPCCSRHRVLVQEVLLEADLTDDEKHELALELWRKRCALKAIVMRRTPWHTLYKRRTPRPESAQQ
eukprot:4558714-Amphidinium_carterae.1